MIEPSYLTRPLTTFLAETFGVSDSPEAYLLESGRAGLLGTINVLIAAHCGHILFLLSF